MSSDNTPSIPISQVAAQFKATPLSQLPDLIEQWSADPRAGVSQLIGSARRRLQLHDLELRRTDSLYALQAELAMQGLAFVVGVDEVGRGAVAGPLTVAAVALPVDDKLLGLDDSKRLSPQRREELAVRIRERASAVSIVHIPAQEIDLMGMALCLKAAVSRALLGAGREPDAVLLDGNPLRIHPRERAIVKGDSSQACIAAASIVAKVTRDAYMVELDSEYPGYGFASSKGYASPEHIDAIRTRGLTPVHRASFCTAFTSETLF